MKKSRDRLQRRHQSTGTTNTLHPKSDECLASTKLVVRNETAALASNSKEKIQQINLCIFKSIHWCVIDRWNYLETRTKSRKYDVLTLEECLRDPSSSFHVPARHSDADEGMWSCNYTTVVVEVVMPYFHVSMKPLHHMGSRIPIYSRRRERVHSRSLDRSSSVDKWPHRKFSSRMSQKYWIH